jgi:hypothetical protein
MIRSLLILNSSCSGARDLWWPLLQVEEMLDRPYEDTGSVLKRRSSDEAEDLLP